jgi:hypothetical protein
MSTIPTLNSAAQSTENVLIAGYGTLLLRESLGDTVSEENADQKQFIPVIISGYKRLFNLIPDHYPIENRIGHGPIEKAAANVEVAEDQSFNAIVFQAKATELDLLDQRERYYKRVTAACVEFTSGTSMGECHFYMSEPDARWIENDLSKVLPLWRDIAYARVGAYRISEAFGKMYDASTWMADGTTRMVDYYKNYLEQLSDLEFEK